MKKIALVSLMTVALMGGVAAQASQVLQCVSKDYDPRHFNGQGLMLSLDDQGSLIKAEKMKGSWLGDIGVVNSPKVLRKTLSLIVYEVNFGGSDYNGRVIFQKNGPVIYQFSYADDERYRTVTAPLFCAPAQL